MVSTYGYSDQRGWLDSLTTMSGATSIQALSYTRDDAGQITAVASTHADESWSYGYDALRRLLSATNTDTPAYNRTYTYDSIGNMLSNSGIAGSYSYPTPTSPRPHAVTAIGGWTYSYDANGNMTAGAGRSFTYNGENRPTQIDTQAYTYGPDGERWKTVDSAPGGGTTLYLGGTIEIAAGVMTKYLPGNAKRVGSPGDPLVETFWLHHDHQGSIQAITDATGTEVQRFLYYPYGDRIATSTAHDESKGWIGERQDATGLFYLHARYYDPVIGRFASADPSDPMQPGVGLNRYAYAGNSPVMRIDPWGLKFVGNDESGGGTKSDYQRRTPHGSMSPNEARWRAKSPGEKVRAEAREKYRQEKLKQQYIDELSTYIGYLDYKGEIPQEFELQSAFFDWENWFGNVNNTIVTGWGTSVDLSEWTPVLDIDGHGKVVFDAGDIIAIAAESGAFPPTFQFGYFVHAHPLNSFGNLETIVTTWKAAQSVYHSSGFTGAGSPNVFVIESSFPAEFGNRWTVLMQPATHSHDNIAWGPYIQIYVPRNGQ